MWWKIRVPQPSRVVFWCSPQELHQKRPALAHAPILNVARRESYQGGVSMHMKIYIILPTSSINRSLTRMSDLMIIIAPGDGSRNPSQNLVKCIHNFLVDSVVCRKGGHLSGGRLVLCPSQTKRSPYGHFSELNLIGSKI